MSARGPGVRRPRWSGGYDCLRDRGTQLFQLPAGRHTLLTLLGCVVVAYMCFATLYVGTNSGRAAYAWQSRLLRAGNDSAPLSRLPVISSEDGPSCDELLQVPKVALLFLTPGKLPHERLWREWLDQASGLLPISSVQRYAGGLVGLRPAQLREVQDACLALAIDRTRPVIDRQLLFTVYVHTHPAFRGYRNFSLFHNHIVSERIIAKRGHHSLTDAERILLVEALKEPLNLYFMLLSETSVPLYPAPLVWEQAMAEMAENISRVDACNYKTDMTGNLERWNDKMETPRFKNHHWRKTSQWFGLFRRHAEVVVADVEVNEAFEKYCVPYFDHVRKRNVSCSSNEHYVAILLAVEGLAAETTCYGGGTTFVDWTKMSKEGRPRSFLKREIKDRLVIHARTRMDSYEATEAALAAAARRFVKAPLLPVGSVWPRLPAPRYPPLNANSSLFIRKFPAETASTARETLRKFIRFPP